jgi:hypothetical protein
MRPIDSDHRHVWTPIDGTMFAAPYAQPTLLVCLEDGKTHSHQWYRFDLDQRPLPNPICMSCGQRKDSA